MLYGLERIATELHEWDVDTILANRPTNMTFSDYILALIPMTLVSLELFNIITNNGDEDHANVHDDSVNNSQNSISIHNFN